MAKTNLRLNAEQEKDLVKYCLDRLVQVRSDNQERIDADKQSKLDYENSKAYREQHDSVYEFSNLSLPLTSMVVDHFCSRSEEEITGSKPFFHFRPKGPSDAETALKIDRYFLNRLVDVGKLKDDIENVFHPIFTQRAAFLKGTYLENYCEWEEYDRLILWDKATDTPLQIIDQGTGEMRYVIFDEETWVEDLDANPETMELELPIRRLAADPSIVITEAQYQSDPSSPRWEDSPYLWQPSPEAIRFREFHYKGPKSQQVDYDCIFIPSKLPKIDDADFIAEIYDKRIEWVRKMWIEGEGRRWADYEQELEPHSDENRTESARSEMDKENRQFDQLNKNVKVLECWLTRDVLGWGEPQRIVVFIDRDNEKAIHYEFAAVVLPDRSRRHPYEAIAIWQQDNLWWGKSVPEMLAPYQEYIDKAWNSWTFRSSVNNGAIIGEHEDATVEGVSLADVEPYQTVPLNAGKTMRDWLEVFTFPQTDQQTGNLVDRIFHWVQLWLGVANIAQGDYSEVPANTTAYGMDATLRESGRLSRRWTRRIIRGLKNHIELLCRIDFATIDEEVLFKYVEGDEELIAWIRRDAVKNMPVDVELVVSKEHTQSIIEANRLAEEIAVKYASYDPYTQEKVRAVFKSSLKALGHDDVDRLLPKPTKEDYEAYHQQQQEEAELRRLTVMQQLGKQEAQQQRDATGTDG